MSPVLSPCCQICVIDPASGLCEGCGRTLDEIAGWAMMDDAARRRAMAVLPMRMAQAFPEAAQAEALS
jgi:predicted Fe-S protein YdhL (DUF1289 family)